jgi:uncharacterized protein (TIGR02266 family)
MDRPAAHVTQVVVFDRSTGPRLEAAERLLLDLSQLLSAALSEADLAFQSRVAFLFALLRLDPRALSPLHRRRLAFWAARAGGRVIALDELSERDRAALLQAIGRCDIRSERIGPAALVAAARELFTAAGAPRDRKRAFSPRPVLALDLAGRGCEGARYEPEGALLFLPGALAPPEGDELTLAVRSPGRESPMLVTARVASVREEGRANEPVGFKLALRAPAPELAEALTRALAPKDELPPGRRRAHPRYHVRAPVLITPVPPEAAPKPVEPSVRLEWASDQELADDYVDNLSQGGAFVRTGTPAAIGTQLRIEMFLPGGDRLSAPATVAYVNDRGMGVRFELSPEQDQTLAAVIARISARPRRALVVDDDEIALRMLHDAFAERGFDVLLARDGQEGLRVVSEELLELDLLVTDVRMPNMDGESFVRTIRGAGGEADLAIVAVTGSLERSVEQRLEQAGADAVLDKSLGASLVAQVSDAVLERKRLSHR